jgi:hypothetical protein
MTALTLVTEETRSGPSPEWIAAEYYERHARRGPVIAQMEAVRDAYNGDVVTPFPEMDRSQDRAVTANLVQQGLDQTALRIAETLPMLDCPPLNPNGKTSIAKADVRRKAHLGWWEANRLETKMGRRARWLCGYSMAPVLLRPDFERGIPEWVPMDPLTVFPASSENPDDLRPLNNIRAYTRTVAYVRATWPHLYPRLLRSADQGDDERLTLLEYTDAEVTVTLVLSEQAGPNVIDAGPAHRGRPGPNTLTSSVGSFGGVNGRQRKVGTDSVLELDRFINRAGTCTAVVPGRITLDRLMGQFDGVLPMFGLAARLQSLQVIEVEKRIYPDAYLVSRPDRQAEFVAGPFDGRTGQVNVVRDGEIHYVNPPANVQADQAIDRLERNGRISANIAAEYGGESPTNVRTGRRGEAVLSQQVDHAVAEAQKIMAASMQEESVIAQKIAKAYFGSRPQTFYISGFKGANGRVDYTPNKDFESDHCVVTYPHAGTDQAALVIGIGQRLNLGTMSKETARWLDPLIGDPRREQHLVDAEALEEALKQSLLQQASAGGIPPADVARIRGLMLLGSSLAEAVQKVHEEAQARQAADAAAAPGSPEAPVDPNSPAAQPGLALPGMGAEAGVSAPPNGGLSNFSMALRDLRNPQRLSPAERTG